MKQWIPQFDLLSQTEQERIEAQFKELDIDLIEETYQDVYIDKKTVDTSNVEEVSYVNVSEINQERLTDLAVENIKHGKVAVLLMAGGQGTRLGYDGPKGTFTFNGVSLFELQARQILKYKENNQLNIHWYIMTSEINNEETIEFFKNNNYFDIPKENVHFFMQEHFPPLSKDGKLLLTKDKNIMLTPNGNGGIFSTLKRSGLLQDIKSRGIEAVFMNNIDNVLVKVLDPLLVGLHIDNRNEITSKSIVPKPGESVGRLALLDGKKGVVEYTEIPEGQDKNFQNGSIGIHVFSVDFLSRAADTKMRYHLALKNLEFLNENLKLIKEEVLKFEKFYFDVFYVADKHNTLQVSREGEFSPLKNKVGQDSVETAHQDLEDNGLI